MHQSTIKCLKLIALKWIWTYLPNQPNDLLDCLTYSYQVGVISLHGDNLLTTQSNCNHKTNRQGSQGESSSFEEVGGNLDLDGLGTALFISVVVWWVGFGFVFCFAGNFHPAQGSKWAALKATYKVDSRVTSSRLLHLSAQGCSSLFLERQITCSPLLRCWFFTT